MEQNPRGTPERPLRSAACREKGGPVQMLWGAAATSLGAEVPPTQHSGQPAWNLRLRGPVEKGEALIDECFGVAALGQGTALGTVRAWSPLSGHNSFWNPGPTPDGVVSCPHSLPSLRGASL